MMKKKFKTVLTVILGILGLLILNYADYKWFNQLNPFYSEPAAANEVSEADLNLLNKGFNKKK